MCPRINLFRPRLGGLPHLPGVPHLHVNRPLESSCLTRVANNNISQSVTVFQKRITFSVKPQNLNNQDIRIGISFAIDLSRIFPFSTDVSSLAYFAEQRLFFMFPLKFCAGNLSTSH